MRDETAAWLEPLQTIATERGIDLEVYRKRATIPAAEAGQPVFCNAMTQILAEIPQAKLLAIDWIVFGQMLRHDLGMDDTYPAWPDFPELRVTP